MTQQKALVTKRDRERLRACLSHPRHASEAEDLGRLSQRLDYATVIEADDIPRSIVTMNSLVELRDLEINEKFSCTLAYPDHAEVVKRKVSVAVPLGIAMLGSRVGDTIECQVPSGTRRLRVERVFYQPEAARDFHL